jgi:hypothetical protein
VQQPAAFDPGFQNAIVPESGLLVRIHGHDLLLDGVNDRTRINTGAHHDLRPYPHME